MFFNALEIEKLQHNRSFYYEEQDDQDPVAVEGFRIKGSFRGNLDFRNFPLDYQVGDSIVHVSGISSTKISFNKGYSLAKQRGKGKL